MTATPDVLRELEALGSEQTRKIYRRHGVPEPMFGVKFGDLDRLRKRLGRDQALARALWQSDNHDARVLAAMIADPAAFDAEALARWQAEATCHVQSDALIAHVGARLSAAAAAAAAWIDATVESRRRAGWVLVSHLAQESHDLEDSFFADLLPRIEREIHGAPDRTREAMNRTLIAIGARSDALARLATAAAREIGPVEVDHGETDCKTPDAVAYIARAREHRAKQEAKGAARSAAKAPAATKKPAAAKPAATGAAKPTTTKKPAAAKPAAKGAAKPTTTKKPAAAEPTATGAAKPAAAKPAAAKEPATAEPAKRAAARQAAAKPAAAKEPAKRAGPTRDRSMR